MTYPFDVSRPVWLIGCGNMAGAMLSRWLETGLDPAAVTIVDPHRTDAPAGVRLLAAPPEDEAPPALLMLGIKPQTFPEIAPRIAALTSSDTNIVSIMAGVDLATLTQGFPDAGGVVRLMPNLPVALGKGVALLFGARSARPAVDALAAPLGLALWVDDEALIDAGTAVSGSGPAFVYRFIDAMAAGAEKLGFTARDAERLALATVEGAAALAASAGESPATLADRVASPKGTTRAGLDVLDADAAIFDLVHRTLRAAAGRAAELAAEARVR